REPARRWLYGAPVAAGERQSGDGEHGAGPGGEDPLGRHRCTPEGVPTEEVYRNRRPEPDRVRTRLGRLEGGEEGLGGERKRVVGTRAHCQRAHGGGRGASGRGAVARGEERPGLEQSRPARPGATRRGQRIDRGGRRGG